MQEDVAVRREPLAALYEAGNFVCLSAAGERLTESALKRGWDVCLNVLSYVRNGRPPKPTPGLRTDKIPGWKPVKFTAHDLRYTYCTMLYDAGVDVKTAQYLMGHSDIMVTMRIYTKLSEERKQTSFDALNTYLKGQISTTTTTTILPPLQ